MEVEESIDSKLIRLRASKNELIGCPEQKQQFFCQGGLAAVTDTLANETDERLLLECLAIVNTFFYEYQGALEFL